MSTERRATFNTVAKQYSDARPGFPAALGADLIARAGLLPGARVLEIGCGTGQATELLAGRGYRMTCLDLGAEMLVHARERCRRDPTIEFTVGAFEQWTPPAGQQFDLILAARCWHWFDPAVRWVKAAQLLKPTGCLALLANPGARQQGEFFTAVQAVYKKEAPNLKRGGKPEGHHAWKPEDGLNHFARVERATYPWSQSYTAVEYIAMLGTYSDHIALPTDRQQALYAGIAAMIDREYGGKVTQAYEAALTMFLDPVA